MGHFASAVLQAFGAVLAIGAALAVVEAVDCDRSSCLVLFQISYLHSFTVLTTAALSAVMSRTLLEVR